MSASQKLAPSGLIASRRGVLGGRSARKRVVAKAARDFRRSRRRVKRTRDGRHPHKLTELQHAGFERGGW
jgi:hypothetical protein